MPRKSCKRNKRTKVTSEQPVVLVEPVVPVEIIEPVVLIEIPPIIIPPSYKDITNIKELVIIEQVPVVEPTSSVVDKGYSTCLNHDQRIIHWERAWNEYLNTIFYGMIPEMYHTAECYNEFVEIAYLLTPFSFRKCRVAYPGDQVTILVSKLPEDIAINSIRNQVLNDGYCLFLDSTNPITIETDFSKYLYGIEAEYVPTFTDEPDQTDVNDDDEQIVFTNKRSLLPAKTPPELTDEQLNYIYDEISD